MGDSVLSLSEITTSFQDNYAGDISFQQIRDLVNSKLNCYGGIYYSGAGVTQSGFTSGVFSKLTVFGADGLASGCTVSHSSDNIIATTAGYYLVNFRARIAESSPAANVFSFRIYNSGIYSGFQAKATLTANEGASLSVSGIMYVEVSGAIEVYASNSTSLNHIDVYSARLSVRRIL